jgi:S1-C subfamily serine protease
MTKLDLPSLRAGSGWTRRDWLARALSMLPAHRLGPAAPVLFAAVATSGAARADLPALVAASRASVLPVGTFNPLDSPRFSFRGSGFVVGDGTLVATNAHVMPDPGAVPPPQIAVLANRRAEGADVRRATLFSLDRNRDLALLRIEGAPLPAMKLAEPGAVREGMDLALMGFPIGGVFGFSMVTHRGILASITSIALPMAQARQLDPRAIAQLREGAFEVYQLDATAYPGNSGGPVLDVASGAVVGVVNMVLVRGTRESALSNPTGITYAIPVRFLQELLPRS